MNACLLLHTCDAYSHLWESCVHYFDKHVRWPWPKWFVSEEQRGVFPGWTGITTGAGEWSDRLIYALEYLEHYDFIFYMQEDVWVKKSPGCGIFGNITVALNYIEINKYYDCVHVQPDCKYYKQEGGLGRAWSFAPDSPYLMNHKPGWWRREFLLRYLTPGQDPWTNEREATKQMQADGVGNRIGLIECDWYDDVCHKGELTDTGKRRMIGQHPNP